MTSTENQYHHPEENGHPLPPSPQSPTTPVLDPALLYIEKSLLKHEDLTPVRQSATTTAAEALLARSRRTWFQGQAITNLKVPPRPGTTRVKIKPSPPVSPISGQGPDNINGGNINGRQNNENVCVISQLFVSFNKTSNLCSSNNHSTLFGVKGSGGLMDTPSGFYYTDLGGGDSTTAADIDRF